nr:hypothetical protein [Tanacetum cinerariifolium]
MSWFSRCSWCGGPFNGENCQQCTNVSFGDEFVRNPDPILNDVTSDYSYPPSQPQRSSFDQFHFFWCGDPFEDGVRCQRCTCKWCGYNRRGGFCLFCPSRDENSSIDAPNPNSFNDPPNVFTTSPQPQYESYSCELCRNGAHYGYDCPPHHTIDHQPIIQEDRQWISDILTKSNNELFESMRSMCKEFHRQKQASNLSTHTPEPSRHFNSICYDDDDDDDDDNDEEKTIPLRDIISQLPPSIVITTSHPVLPIEDFDDSLIMGNEEFSTILKKESDEVIKSSVEDFVPIPSESKDTSRIDSECDLPSCDDFSPTDVPEGKSVTFSNPLFDSNDDFTSSDDESLSDEDVPKDNVKIYLNPFFEFDDEYISSDVNPLFDEVLGNIESKVSYYSNLDEPNLLATPLSDTNEDECFDPGGNVDEIDAFVIPLDFEDGYYDSEGDVLYLKSLLSDDTTPNLSPEVFLNHDPRSLNDINDLKITVEVFDPGILEKFFLQHMIALDYKDSRARGFVHRSLELQSLACLYMWESDILDLID